jgi:O-antigen/teichoic acid export membrane protein
MSFIASLACAKLLGKVGFGELGIIRNTISTMGIFAGLGLGVTATKHIAEFREKDVERTARIIQLCLWVAVFSGAFMTLVLMLGSSVIAENVLAAPHLAPSLLLGALLLFVYAYDGAQKGILAGFEAYRQSAVIHIIGGMTTVVSVFGGARLRGTQCALGDLYQRP